MIRTQTVINISGETVKFRIAGANNQEHEDYSLAPKQTLELPEGYARPVRVGHGLPRPSAIDMLTGGRVLATDDKRAAAVVAQLVAQGNGKRKPEAGAA